MKIITALLIAGSMTGAPSKLKSLPETIRMAPQVQTREAIRFTTPVLPAGMYQGVLLARQATIEGLADSSDGACPYRGNAESYLYGFSAKWDLDIQPGVLLHSVKFHLRTGRDPHGYTVSVVRTSRADGSTSTIATQDFGNSLPRYDSSGHVIEVGAIPCSDVETDLAPQISALTLDTTNFSYALVLNGTDGGHEGTRVYFVEYAFEVR